MKIVYLILAFLLTALGAVGAVLPILPSVPFLILASLCFAKGSQRFNDWFLASALYKNYLQEFTRPREMTRKSKIKILVIATFALLAAFVWAEAIYSKLAIIAVLAFKYYYVIFKLKP